MVFIKVSGVWIDFAALLAALLASVGGLKIVAWADKTWRQSVNPVLRYWGVVITVVLIDTGNIDS
jgi:hypothetical protein